MGEIRQAGSRANIITCGSRTGDSTSDRVITRNQTALSEAKEQRSDHSKGSVQTIVHGFRDEMAIESKDLQEKNSFSNILQRNAQTTRNPAAMSVRADRQAHFLQRHRCTETWQLLLEQFISCPLELANMAETEFKS